MQPDRRPPYDKSLLQWVMGLGIILSLVIMAPAWAQSPKIIRFDRAGIIVYALQTEGMPNYTVTALLRAGSILDEPQKGGLAHATLLMVERDLKSQLEINGLGAIPVEVALGDFSASISMRIPVEGVDLGMAVLAKSLSHPAFEGANLGAAIRHLQRAYLHESNGVAMVPARALEFQLHRGYDDYLTTPSSLGRLRLADIKTFHQRYYAPNNLWLAVAAPDSPRVVDEHISSAFAHWPKKNISFAQRSGRLAPVYGWQHMSIPGLQTGYVAIGGFTGGRWDPDRHELAVLLDVLEGALLDKGIPMHLEWRAGEPGRWWMWMQASESQLPTLWYTIQQVCDKLATGAISDRQVVEARQGVLAKRSITVRSAGDRVAEYAFNEVTGYPGDQGIRDGKAYKRVRGKDVRALARQVLQDDLLVGVVVMGDESDIPVAPVKE